MKDHLRLLSIFHYVVGGMQLVCGSLPLIHVAVGTFFLLGPVHTKQGEEAFPAIFGMFFVLIGSLFVLLGWTLGICTIVSGRRIAERRSRIFSIVIAAINCMHMPFGTTLGVFTLVLLNQDEAKRLYGEPVGEPLGAPLPPPSVPMPSAYPPGSTPPPTTPAPPPPPSGNMPPA